MEQASAPAATDTPTPARPLYRDPRPLNPMRHSGKSLVAPTNVAFARHTNALALVLPEFPAVMRSYPIVFSAGETKSAIAMVGLRSGDNLFIDEDGQWLADHYVPAYVRRHPFILMDGPEANQLVLCIDEESEFVVESAGRPLFSGEKPTQLVSDALKLCGEIHTAHLATTEFISALSAQNLLVRNQTRLVTGSGEQITVQGFDVIDEARFNTLPDAVLLDWRRRGWLAPIYCHFLSMANWGRLAEMGSRRAPTQSAAS